MNDVETALPSEFLSEAPTGPLLITPVYFGLLSVSSFGLYPVWWLYKGWRFFRQKEQSDISPAGRTLMTGWFLASFLNKVKALSTQQTDYTPTYSSAALTAGFIISSMCGRLPDPYWLIAVFSFVFLIPGVKAFNFALINSPTYQAQEKVGYTTRQLILLLVGSLLWALIVLGSLSPLLGLDDK